MKLIFLDTETTGVDTKVDRLCQVCYRIGDEVRTEYFKPPMPIPAGATNIHHISNEMVEDKPAFKGSAMHTDLENILDDHVLVAHNATYDCAMLANEGVQVPRKICTLRVVKHLDADEKIQEYNLQYLRNHFGIVIDATAHDAKGDVAVLHGVFGKLLEEMMKSFPNEESAIEEMIKISARPSLLKRLKFGKYKGVPLRELVAKDRGYLQWLLDQRLASGGEEDDVSYSLKHYLGK